MGIGLLNRRKCSLAGVSMQRVASAMEVAGICQLV